MPQPSPSLSPKGIPLPVKVLSTAAALTFSLFLGLGWYIWDLVGALGQLERRHARTLELIWDAGTATSALWVDDGVPPAPNNPLWRAHHERSRTRWEQAVEEARRISPELFREGPGARFLATGRDCLEREGAAIARATAGDATEAVRILSSAALDAWKAEYARSLLELSHNAGVRMKSEIAVQRRRGMFAAAAAGLAFVPLIFSWVVSVRVTGRHFEERLKAENAVRESEKRFRTLADTAPVLIWMSGTEMLYTYFSRGWLQFTGRTHAEEAGNGWLRGVHPDDLGSCRAAYGAAFRKRQPFRVEYRLRRADGEYRWVLDAGAPRRLPDGRFAGYIGCCFDITERRAAEQALQSNMALLRQFVEHAPAAVAMFDADMRYLLVSKRWLADYNLGDGSIIGRSHDDISPEMPDCWKEVHQRCLKGAVESCEEYAFVRRAGNIDWIRWEVRPWHDSMGRIAGLIMFTELINERKQAEEKLRESERRLRTLFEGIDDALFVHDLDGRIIDCNEAACRRLGYTRSQLLQLWTREIDSPRFAAGFVDRSAIQLVEKQLAVEGEHIAKDGRIIPVEINTTLIQYEDRYAVLAVVRDITERKRAAEDLERLKQSAEAASAAKSQFLANMSHEIRTPMNGILGMAQLALDTALTAEQREYIELVNRSANSLLELINDILDFSKVEAGRIELQPEIFSLRDHLSDAIKVVAHRAHEKRLQLALHVPPDVPHAVIGDPLRLRQIVLNLTGNAIKFTAKGEVLVSVRRIAPSTGSSVRLEFRIADTGIGVPPEKTEDIFKPFTQADGSITRRYGGTGLGLAISAQLVRLMGGEIRVESESGKGSTFIFSVRFGLPVAQPTVAEETHAGGPAASLAGIEVLLVDGSPTTGHILDEMLRGWKFVPVAAASADSGMEALERALAANRRIPLAIVDTDAPGAGGTTFVETCVRRLAAAGPAIVLLTSNTATGDRERARTSGAAAIVPKPVKQSDLLDALTVAAQRLSIDRLEASVLSPEPAAAISSTLAADAPAARRVLLAEDNIVNQKLAVRLLEKRGHSVFVASNGQEALDALDRESFDVILMDVQMPVMGGFEATARIREREREEARRTGTAVHVPIVALTANAMKGDRERCLLAGMDHYLSKPIRQDDLHEAVENPSIIQESALPPSFLANAGELAENGSRFFHECQVRMARIDASISTGDAIAVEEAARDLKEALSTLGAPRVAHAAASLETIAKRGDLSQLSDEWLILRAMIEHLGFELRALRERSPDGEKAPA